jgi:hypothetical protein
MNNNEEDDKNINEKNKNMNNKKDKNEKNDKNIDEEDKVLKEIFFETSEKFVDTILKGDFSIDKMIDIFLDAGFKGFDTFFLNKISFYVNNFSKLFLIDSNIVFPCEYWILSSSLFFSLFK